MASITHEGPLYVNPGNPRDELHNQIGLLNPTSSSRMSTKIWSTFLNGLWLSMDNKRLMWLLTTLTGGYKVFGIPEGRVYEAPGFDLGNWFR